MMKQKKMYGSVKISLKNPNILVLNNNNKVLNNSIVDSSDENKMMSFLLSHKKGLKRQEKIMPGLRSSMPSKVGAIPATSNPALLVSSCC